MSSASSAAAASMVAFTTAFFEEHKHELVDHEHAAILALESAALRRRRCKFWTRLVFYLLPFPVLVATLLLIGWEDEFDSANTASTVLESWAFVYVVAVTGTGLVSMALVMAYMFVQLADHRAVARHYRAPGDANAHVMGHDKVSAYSVFALVLLNVVNGIRLVLNAANTLNQAGDGLSAYDHLAQQVGETRGALELSYAEFRWFTYYTLWVQIGILCFGFTFFKQVTLHS